MVDLKIDMAELERQLLPLAAFPKEAQAAVHKSLKRSMISVRTQISRKIREKSTLRSQSISRAVGKVNIITQGSFIEGSVRVASPAVHLSEYQIAPKRATAQKGKRPQLWRPLRWRVAKGEAFKENNVEDGFSKAFAAYAKSGKLIVFRRKGQRLHAQFGPRVQYFMVFDRVQKPLEKIARERFEKALLHEVKHRLSKLK